MFKPSKLFWKEQLLYASLEQVTGLEPVPSAWQAEILTDYTIPAYGGQDWNRTRNLLITNQLHCQLCYLAKLVSRGFEPLSAYSLRSNAGLLTTWVSTGNYGPGKGNRTPV